MITRIATKLKMTKLNLIVMLAVFVLSVLVTLSEYMPREPLGYHAQMQLNQTLIADCKWRYRDYPGEIPACIRYMLR